MLAITSSAFEHEGRIPQEYTCDGERTKNPPLTFGGVPETAISLVLLCEDPDVPLQIKADGMFDHLVLFNISPTVALLPEGELVGVAGVNGRGEMGYSGPCPPTQFEPREHRYFFRLYALDTMLPLPPGASKQQVVHAMQGHIVEEATLLGRYARV